MGDVSAIRPQPGPQETFLSSPADIAIYGGAAGGGKTWALLMEPLRHIGNGGFAAVIFRRNFTQVSNPGGLWDESIRLYSQIPGSNPRLSTPMRWDFPSGATVSFAHLEHDTTVLSWQGAQVPLLCFDELCHFSKEQFFYLLSRNRSMCGVRPYVRATCNPDSESWVAEFIGWWIDQDTGLPIPERSGKLRWFVRLGDNLIWADRPEELPEQKAPDGQIIPPKSVTFVAAKLTDNKALMAVNPEYYGNLLSLGPVERGRLLDGNWKVKAGADFFTEASLLVDGVPPPFPALCDSVFAVIDTAVKTGTANDGTGVSFWAYTKGRGQYPLTALDWDYVQIEGSLLELWLPRVFSRLEELAGLCHARMGASGVFIEDAASGSILLQQARRKGWNVQAIDTALTSQGKDGRAISASGFVYHGQVKISAEAYNKTTEFKGQTRNHFLAQILGFRIGDKDAARRADDLLDTFTYAVTLALGDASIK